MLGTDHEVGYSQDGTDEACVSKRTEIGEWYGVELFASLIAWKLVEKSKYGVSPFTASLHWPSHGFYINGFQGLKSVFV